MEQIIYEDNKNIIITPIIQNFIDKCKQRFINRLLKDDEE
jgi:hypothetical protein